MTAETEFEPCSVNVRIKISALCLVYALTIIAGAIGEWNYYILGSAIEIAQPAAVVYYAWTWPRAAPPATARRQTV